MEDTTKKLSDHSSSQVYWAQEQVRWTDIITQRLKEIRETLPTPTPADITSGGREGVVVPHEKKFGYHVYVLCSILVPYDADCEIDLQCSDDNPLWSAFRLQINMGLKRWNEFKYGATAFWQEVIRQVAVMEKVTGTVVEGFEAKLHKDHFSVHNGSGTVRRN